MARSLRFAVFAVALAAGLSLSACQNERPTWPVNHNPIISSAIANPTDLGPSDSTVISVIAADQDGDTLVYDWDTDLRLRIKGAHPGRPVKTNTPNSSETFYLNYSPIGVDSAWVVCSTRDLRGGVASRVVYLIVHP